MVVLTCCAPFGVAGLGRTLSDATAALRGDGHFHVSAARIGTGVPTDSAGAIRDVLERRYAQWRRETAGGRATAHDRHQTGAAARAAGGRA